MCRAIELASRRWREVMIYALGLAMSGKNPTMPPRNSSALASASVLSKMLAASACMVCRGGGVMRGGWKAWPSASTLHRRPSRRSECGIVLLQRRERRELLSTPHTNQMVGPLWRQELAALFTNRLRSRE